MRNPDRETVFKFKQFDVINRRSAMKVGTDGVLLGAWGDVSRYASDAVNPTKADMVRNILDVGCGTGVISLMQAQRFPHAVITGIEIDPEAAAEARENFEMSPWADRLRLIKGDFITCFGNNLEAKFDLIVSNPPFFTNGQLSPDKSRLTARHDTTLSLETLLNTAAGIISENGSLCLILPADREEDLKWLAVVNRFHIERLVKISTVPHKPPRRLLAELVPPAANGHQTRFSSLSIHCDDGNFSKEYADLLKDFYLKF